MGNDRRIAHISWRLGDMRTKVMLAALILEFIDVSKIVFKTTTVLLHVCLPVLESNKFHQHVHVMNIISFRILLLNRQVSEHAHFA